jgi:LacI family transcriptional regulator, galactose operon repressor
MAGVSVATASRALAGRGEVSPGTRRAVEDASKRLGYRPDPVAAALRTRTTGTFGMVVPQIADWFYPPMVASVEHEFAKRQLGLLLADSRDDVSLEADRLETLLRRRVDGLIVCPVDSHDSAPALLAASRQVPTMQIDRHAVDNIDFVGFDEAQGMAQIAQHLSAMGARTATFVGCDPAVSSAQERADGFAVAATLQGIAVIEAVEVLDVEGQTDFTAGQLFATRVLEQKLPDAIVCANDLLAFGALAGLRAHGVRCPEDVLITGYDDDAPMAELMGLTTVRTPLAEIGREAARLLLNKSPVPRHVRLLCTLVVRETTRRMPSQPEEPEGARRPSLDAAAEG